MVHIASTGWQPHLHGELLTLRPLEKTDFEALHAAAADPLIWEQHPEPDRWQRDVFRRYFVAGLECRGALVVLDAATNAVVGSSRFLGHDPARSSVEIGYTFLARRCWGGRYNRELKALMLEYAFERVSTVYFVVGDRNLRSQKAVLKLGAAEERREGAKVFFRLEKTSRHIAPPRSTPHVPAPRF